MRGIFSIMIFIALTAMGSDIKHNLVSKKANSGEETNSAAFSELLGRILLEKKEAKLNLGFTKGGRPVEAYYFPGTSNRNALVIGGVHGSELSSIEVTTTLIAILSKNKGNYYNVLVIPSLFPDNAATARTLLGEIGSCHNIGRYSFPGATDPNRQMPTPGLGADLQQYRDYAGRITEMENRFLLQVIRIFKPQRIASVHAIHNENMAGFFADPRTDENGIALGYESDSSLAVSMAVVADNLGGRVPGNMINQKANALYYKDPPAVAKGLWQKRNFKGSNATGYIGSGVSLGTWGSTAVNDSIDAFNNRDAIRIITIEFPGNKRPVDYKDNKQQKLVERGIKAFATAIVEVFLNDYFVENN